MGALFVIFGTAFAPYLPWAIIQISRNISRREILKALKERGL